ncbi:MAG TPA: hypothetical protein VGP15_04460, partial [Burkholderiales bacterium]|nr:hypothetical protein [Burkholderiales bacterium]
MAHVNVRNGIAFVTAFLAVTSLVAAAVAHVMHRAVGSLRPVVGVAVTERWCVHSRLGGSSRLRIFDDYLASFASKAFDVDLWDGGAALCVARRAACTASIKSG